MTLDHDATPAAGGGENYYEVLGLAPGAAAAPPAPGLAGEPVAEEGEEAEEEDYGEEEEEAEEEGYGEEEEEVGEEDYGDEEEEEEPEEAAGVEAEGEGEYADEDEFDYE